MGLELGSCETEEAEAPADADDALVTTAAVLTSDGAAGAAGFAAEVAAVAPEAPDAAEAGADGSSHSLRNAWIKLDLPDPIVPHTATHSGVQWGRIDSSRASIAKSKSGSRRAVGSAPPQEPLKPKREGGEKSTTMRQAYAWSMRTQQRMLVMHAPLLSRRAYQTQETNTSRFQQ